MGPGETADIADEINQKHPLIDIAADGLAINGHR
jgi:hypothetical protein